MYARKSTPLTQTLLDINYAGACVIAAHQYLVAKKGARYVDKNGKPDVKNRENYIQLGKAVIEYLIKS